MRLEDADTYPQLVAPPPKKPGKAVLHVSHFGVSMYHGPRNGPHSGRPVGRPAVVNFDDMWGDPHVGAVSRQATSPRPLDSVVVPDVALGVNE